MLVELCGSFKPPKWGCRANTVVPVFRTETYLVQTGNSREVARRMAEADPQAAFSSGDGVVTPADSNAAAVSQLFREHNRMLVGYLTVRLRSEQEAKEVAQEAYVRLLELRKPGSPDSLRALLFKMAGNLAIDRLRHRKVRSRIEENVRSRIEEQEALGDIGTARGESDDPAKQFLAREQIDRLLKFLQELPIKCQHVLSLHRLEGIPQQEVAARLGLSERMVRRYVTYAMVYCHLRMEGMAVDQVRQRVSL
jgi:RNA polymerase sigma factor (sigma-70 family)